MLRYGPPMSDSDDSDPDDLYEGFSFNDGLSAPQRSRYVPPKNPLQDLLDAVNSSNLKQMINEMTKKKVNIDDIVANDTTLLHLACRRADTKIVKYLLDNSANANRVVDSRTPLIEACSFSEDENRTKKNIYETIFMLLENGAVINVADKYGMTPFMFACHHGHLEVLKKMISEVSLEACNNEGKTCIYIAIENNRLEVVKFLIEAGINCNVIDNKGYTPKQVAENYGFYDISDILPKEDIVYCVPHTFLTYNSIRDHIPRIFLKSEVPEYFQEIYKILQEIGMENFLQYFAKGNVNLAEFLRITDEQMKEIGIIYPYQRNRIRMGLLYFYDILKLSANHLKNLVIINSTVQYLEQNIKEKSFGNIKPEQITTMKESLRKYADILKQLKKTTKYLQSFSPKRSPIYVDYDDYINKKKKTNKVKCCIKYSLLIGVSLIICIKFKGFVFQKHF